MTQELVASMLGVRREGITEAAGKLQRAGFIRYRRGHIAVLDRSGLEARACECYAVVKGIGPPAVRRAVPRGRIESSRNSARSIGEPRDIAGPVVHPVTTRSIASWLRPFAPGACFPEDLVEAMHHAIARAPGILDPPAQGPTSGTTGLVYETVRAVNRLVGGRIDANLAALIPMLGERAFVPRRGGRWLR